MENRNLDEATHTISEICKGDELKSYLARKECLTIKELQKKRQVG